MLGLFVTFFVTLMGVAGGILNPFYGVLAYVALAIFKPESLYAWSVPSLQYSKLVTAAMLIGWAIRGFGDWRLKRAWLPFLCLFGFFTWGVVGTGLAAHFHVGLGFVDSIFKIVLPVFVALTVIKTTRELKLLAWTIVLSLGWVALEMNLSYFSGYNRLRVNGFAGLDNNSMAIAFNAAIGLAFFMGLYERALWKKGVAWFLAFLMIHCVMFSFSRGGLLALCITGGVSFLLIPRRFGHYCALAVAVIIGSQLAGEEVQKRFLSTFAGEDKRDASADSRLQLWAACAQVMAENPVNGVGPDHWQFHAARFGFEDGKAAHSLWFEMGAEHGFPGLLCLMGYYAVCVLRLWPRRKLAPADDDWSGPIACMVISSLIGFGVAAQFVTIEALEAPYYVALLGIASLKVYGNSAADADDFAAEIPAEDVWNTRE